MYEATVENVKSDVSKTGNPMLKFNLRIYSPTLGEAVIKDNLPMAFPAKVKAFWMAFNDFSEEDLSGVKEVAIDNVQDLEGAQILVQLGDQENKESGKVYRTVVAPWYYPTSRGDLLPLDEDLPL